jgi:hypothetical protein
MRLQFSGSRRDVRELLCYWIGCPKPKTKVWTIHFEPDQKMKVIHMILTKPITPGFRRPFTITPDEAVDQAEDGSFFAVEVLDDGDSSVTLDPESTATSLRGWLNGDGSTGSKRVRFSADGRLGEGEQPVTLEVEYTVATPDATSLDNFVEGADEPIPE